MAATLCAKFLPKQGWVPLVQSVRHGSKAVTRHRRPMHHIKQKLMAVTQYIPLPRGPPRGAYPAEAIGTKEVQDPFTLLLKKNLKKVFQDSKMVAVVQNNSCNAEDMINFKYRLHKHGISVKFFPNKVVQSFMTDSIYCNMIPLFIGSTVLLVSKEPKAKEMLLTLRPFPQLVLLGACMDDRLMSAQGLVSYSKLPSLTVVQGELVSGLTMLTSHTASLLQQHPAHLSALLQRYVEQQSPNSGTEDPPKAEEAT
ncbi:large ribosomal subunit protein uL10m [Brachionichthys hirsutus]|uniref:large ribosomal subunit protein uL10m n=1 Tax=Brachionichthys hirsutus TaxID=412623 RepID=UPI0036053872